MKAPVIVRGREAVGVWKRLMSVLLVVLLCCPIFAVRAEKITADGRVNRALLVGCDRFLTQTDTTPSSRNNVLRMADALSGGTLNMQTLVTREDGLSSASALVALIRETFSGADADDVSYFYISTHGLWNTAVNGLMTLLLSDGESEEGITAYELRRVFDTIPGKKVLLLDACHSGAMIGKGVEKSFENLFAGDNYYVVCSSGGEEESWYWTGEVGKMLENLVVELKGFEADAEEPKGIFKIFHSADNRIERMKARYNKANVNVENIATSLEGYQAQLLKDVAMFDRLYDQNTAYFRQLTLYIIAGEEKLQRVREGELKELMAKAAESGDAMDAQKANDLAAQCDRFEKKLHDLKLTRQVSMQMAPQIRLLQNNDSLLVERIQSTISNTLPLWKNQMVLALGLHHTQQAMQAQRAVTNMTNELLKKNAETLKMSTIETAKESERGIIDIETLVQTNQSLIDTISEVMTIQQEGHTKRVEAEKTLYQMENDLKKKLLETKI